jgi:hypothetical protein
LPELQIIKLLVHDTHFISLINHCTFPSLRHFESYLKLSNPLVKFLNRHPNISYLQVSPYEDTSVLSDGIFQTLSLPKLQYFAGNGQSVPAIGDSSILRAAIVSWDAVDAAPDVAIKALERSSFDTLTLLSCTRRGWNLDLIQIISNHLPDILSLHISNVLLVDSHPTEVSSIMVLSFGAVESFSRNSQFFFRIRFFVNLSQSPVLPPSDTHYPL